jgi:hypothetical protein
MSQIIVATVVASLLVVLAVVLIRFNLKRVHIRRRAAKATDAQLEAIYSLVEAIGTEPPRGCVLARTNRVAPDTFGIISFPDVLAEFPWKGRAVSVSSDLQQPFRFTHSPLAATQLVGRVFRPMQVPRRRGRSGQVKSVLSPNRYISGNEALDAALRQVCPEYPAELLSYLLSAGADTFEFEPIDQARIGGSAAWVQDPELQKCDECGQTMALILQLPGSLLSSRGSRGTFYWFGCRQHLDATKTVAQFT